MLVRGARLLVSGPQRGTVLRDLPLEKDLRLRSGIVLVLDGFGASWRGRWRVAGQGLRLRVLGDLESAYLGLVSQGQPRGRVLLVHRAVGCRRYDSRCRALGGGGWGRHNVEIRVQPVRIEDLFELLHPL